MKLSDKLRAQYVQRWTTVHLTHRQSLAEHSFNVALIAMELSSIVFGDYDELFSNQVLYYAITHDLDEVITGDIPSPTKRRLIDFCPEIENILGTANAPNSLTEYSSEMVANIVKIADIIESAFQVKQHGDGIHARQVADDMSNIMAAAISKLKDESLRNAAWGIWHSLNNDQREW